MPTAPSLSIRSSRRFPRAAVVALLVSVGTHAATDVQALSPSDRRLTSARTGIAVEAPAGWTLSQHSGYSDTVVLLVHPDGSRISVSAAATSARTAEELYNQNRPGLIAQGLVPSVTTSGSSAPPGPQKSLVVDLGGPGRPDRVRQLYLVREIPSGWQAIVLTLVCGTKAFPSRLSALDFVASRLSFEDPLPPSSATGRPSITGGAAGNGGSGSGAAGGAPTPRSPTPPRTP
ncbi:MAG: hypothetical protein ABI560_15135 [Myxococcales bacterium]